MPNLTLAGHEYDVELLKRVSGTAPKIEVNLSDINDGSNPEHKPKLSDPFEIDDVIFYKQHGKMTVLLGDVEKNTKDGKVKGKLLSGPVIKKARLDSPAFFQQPTVATPRYSEEFNNRPRFAGGLNANTGNHPRPQNNHR